MAAWPLRPDCTAERGRTESVDLPRYVQRRDLSAGRVHRLPDMAILAAVDGGTENDDVATVGADLAAAYDDELVLLSVMTEEEFEERWRDDEEFNVETATEAATARARTVRNRALGPDSVATVQGRVGEPAEEIVSEADRLDARYVVVGGRKRSPAGKVLFGSTTQAVLLSADRPVVATLSG